MRPSDTKAVTDSATAQFYVRVNKPVTGKVLHILRQGLWFYHLKFCYLFVAAAAFVICNGAMAQTNNASDDKSTPVINQLQTVGQGEMQWLFIDLYQAKLYAKGGEYRAHSYPHALDIAYRIDIDKEDLVTATQEQWQQLSFEGQRYQRWLSQLSQIWPDIKSGDKLTFVVTDENTSRFYHNGELLSSLNQPGFADAFLAIWLSPNTSRPDLRRQLLGLDK